MKIQKILIIRFSSIGDIVLTSPIVRTIKQQLKAEVHFLVKPAFVGIVVHNPNIDKVHILHANLKQTIAELKNEGFDLIIDLQKNLNSFRIKNALPCTTVSFDKLNIKKWLLVHLKINKLPNVHIVTRYFDAVQPLGVTDDGLGLEYFILPENEYDAIGLVENIKYQVLVLGANYFTKRIPLSKCAEIIEKSAGNTVILGGADVAEDAKTLSEKYPVQTINLCGKVSLAVSAGIIKHANRVITGDTGLMHIAAAFQKEIVVLWGNTAPVFGMYPYFGTKNTPKHTNLEVENLSCRPCSKLGHSSCPKKHFRCMMDIDVSTLA